MEPFKVIRLTQGKATIVDPEDYDRVSRYKWRAAYCKDIRTHYVHTSETVDGKQRTVVLHRLIMCPSPGEVVDHINHDTLDNRKCNLRVCLPHQNSLNRRTHISKWKGVSWDKRNRAWRARIRINGVLTHLGLFKEHSDALRAYDEAAIKHFGEFAWTNLNPHRY